ncbi:TPA: hypothetical protein PFE09_002154 [Kluyvera ascorbata]|jgi:hypothetical protein|nr:hypothetical protein [Kluyvera ascorbata]
MSATNKQMTGEQLDELMMAAVSMQRDSEKLGERHVAVFAYAVQVAVIDLRRLRSEVVDLMNKLDTAEINLARFRSLKN